jgi:membrane protease YdiL (CAAX protease family)
VSRIGDLPRRVTVVLWLGVTSFWAGQISLYLLADLALSDSILLATLLVVMPALAVAQAPLTEYMELERLPAYWSSIATLGLLGTISWLVGTRVGGLAAIGVAPLAPSPFIAWTLGLLAASLTIIIVFRQIAVVLRLREGPLLRELLPRTGDERRVFAVLSVVAGVAEEVAYRGYAIPVLLPVLGPVGALLLTSAVFGVLHAYQGALGILRTAVMGATLGGSFLLSGSLLPSVAAHVLIDLLAGLVLADKLLLPLVTEVAEGDPLSRMSKQTHGSRPRTDR